QQRARSAAFNTPALDLAIDVGIEMNPRVRVHPLELHDLALKADGLVAIELGGERVVRNGSASRSHCEDGADRGSGPLLHLHGTKLLKLLFAGQSLLIRRLRRAQPRLLPAGLHIAASR